MVRSIPSRGKERSPSSIYFICSIHPWPLGFGDLASRSLGFVCTSLSLSSPLFPNKCCRKYYTVFFCLGASFFLVMALSFFFLYSLFFAPRGGGPIAVLFLIRVFFLPPHYSYRVYVHTPYQTMLCPSRVINARTSFETHDGEIRSDGVSGGKGGGARSLFCDGSLESDMNRIPETETQNGRSYILRGEREKEGHGRRVRNRCVRQSVLLRERERHTQVHT